jgi:hypothetical protein
VLLGADEHLQVFERPVAVCSVISQDRLSSQRQGGYVLLTKKISHPTETRFNQIRCGKAIKYNFAFCVVGDAGEKRTFNAILNLKCFIHAVKFRWPTQKLLCPPKFSFIILSPLRNLVWPPLLPGGPYDSL